MLSRRGEQPLVVRIAADHPVQHDHIGPLDTVRVRCDVMPAPYDAVLEPGVAEQPLRLAVIGIDQLEAHHLCGTAAKQLDLDLADTATDLEHSGALDVALVQEFHYPPGRLIQTVPAVPLRDATRIAGAKELITATRVTTIIHSVSIAPGRPPAPSRTVES